MDGSNKERRSPKSAANAPSHHHHHHHHPMERPEDSADLRAILRDNGEEHLFRSAMKLSSSDGNGDEQDLPLILHWQHAREFVEAMRTLPSSPQPIEPPFQIPSPLTERSFKVALLEHLRCENEDIATEPVETSILPYTVDYLGQCAAKMVELRHHPWTQEVIRRGGQRLLPLAVPYIARPQTEIMKRFLGTQTTTLWS
ncbi:hypothetical protein Gpo141_00011090 [Globisporangium polare]